MIRHSYWVAAILFAALVLAKFSPETGFTSLIRFGETWQDRRLSALAGLPLATIRASDGYDGQFYAQLALDPLLRGSELAKCLDAPEYRAHRIFAPALAFMLGMGHPWWILQAYALLNVACWAALASLLYHQTKSGGWIGFARWAGCMLGMGTLDSVRQSLVDLPAMLMLFLAVDSATKPQPNKSSFWLVWGNLAKETNLLGTFALHAAELAQKAKFRRAILGLALAALPVVLWAVYVHQRFRGATAAAGLGNFTWPLLGLLGELKVCLGELISGNLDGRFSFGLLAVLGLSVQFAVLWRSPAPQVAWWRVGAAYSLLLPFLGVWVWSGYWAACRAVLPMTVAFNLLLPANRSFWVLWLTGNLTLLHAIWRFL